MAFFAAQYIKFGPDHTELASSRISQIGRVRSFARSQQTKKCNPITVFLEQVECFCTKNYLTDYLKQQQQQLE